MLYILIYRFNNIFVFAFFPDQGDEGFSGLPGSDGESGDDVSFSSLSLFSS